MRQFCIDNCSWWTLIALLHISIPYHVDGHTIQVEPRQENEEQEVATPGKKTPL